MIPIPTRRVILVAAVSLILSVFLIARPFYTKPPKSLKGLNPNGRSPPPDSLEDLPLPADYMMTDEEMLPEKFSTDEYENPEINHLIRKIIEGIPLPHDYPMPEEERREISHLYYVPESNFDEKFTETLVGSTCEQVWNNWTTIAQSQTPEIPLVEPPREKLAEFTLYGRIPLKQEYVNEKAVPIKMLWDDIDAQMMMTRDEVIERAHHVGYGDIVYEAMDRFHSFIQNKSGAVFGATNPWIEVFALRHGATSVLTVEQQEIEEKTSQNLSYIHPRDLANQWANYSETFDFIASFSSIQHAGLGRFGDPIDPWGDLREITKMRCLLKEGGIVILGLPIGVDELYWNARRVYGTAYVPIFVDMEMVSVMIFIIGLIRCYTLLFLASIVPLITLERLMATIYLWDYEKSPRTYISLSIMLSSVLIFLTLSTFSCIAIAYDMLRTVIGVVISLLGAILLSGMLCAFLFTYNSKVLKWLDRVQQHERVESLTPRFGHRPYDLSVRYQIKENMRVFVILRRFLIITIISETFGSITGGIAFTAFESDSIIGQVMMIGVDLMLTLSFTTFPFGVLWIVKEWREKYDQWWRHLLRTNKSVSVASSLIIPSIDYAGDTNKYFDYYRQNW
ncbi:unnamed protein product, partial [Mesorhabditis belari]|uniref:Uncharacterized protein n=1 Tax=Mesorhabditis belari TaxID=2138241 RepID=A0AAF3EXP6_9BILA